MAELYYRTLATKIYDSSLDMDYQDYNDYSEIDIALLANELQKMDSADSIVFKALEKIFVN